MSLVVERGKHRLDHSKECLLLDGAVKLVQQIVEDLPRLVSLDALDTNCLGIVEDNGHRHAHQDVARRLVAKGSAGQADQEASTHRLNALGDWWRLALLPLDVLNDRRAAAEARAIDCIVVPTGIVCKEERVEEPRDDAYNGACRAPLG